LDSRVGDGDVPGPEEEDCKGHVPLLAAESEKRNFLSGYLSAPEKPLKESGSLGEKDAEQAREIVGEIWCAAARIEAVIRKMMDFSKPRAPRMELADLNVAIKDALDFYAISLPKSGIVLDRSRLEPVPKCRADSQMVVQVLLNLLINASQAMEKTPGDRIIRVASRVAGRRIVISVADTGPGIAQPLRDEIFDPFFTTRLDGYGIGLSFSRRVAEDHGGSLTVTQGEWGGAEFRIELPCPTQ
jgi:signal transduction histidine kinase